ncbi:unnamed protein product [Caenorhabditis sp. 36 PRJEB53466]|nr:unnamed protein product [Caenorhabditis sp. 36 PRJEB53466]
MTDKGTQCHSTYEHYFAKLYDDVFGIYEEELVPLASITEFTSTEDQKRQRVEMAEMIKLSKLKQNMDSLAEGRKESEKSIVIRLADEVFEHTGNEENERNPTHKTGDDAKKVVEELEKLSLNRRLQQAYTPLDIHVPNTPSDLHIAQWSLGGPLAHQYKLVTHLLAVSRNDSKPRFYEMVAHYLAFRENMQYAPRNDEEISYFIKDYTFDKVEELEIIAMFYPNTHPMKTVDDRELAQEGASFAKMFLKLNFLTEHNQIFKTFVKKCFDMKEEVRNMLASRYLYKRMKVLGAQFYLTKCLKHNIYRIIWERKFYHMDDYFVCLVLFMHDKAGNITWEEVEELLYPEAKDIIRRSFILSRQKSVVE